MPSGQVTPGEVLYTGVTMRRRQVAFDIEKYVEAVEEARRQLVRAMPDADPGDLLLIAQSLLRPFGSGKTFFLLAAPGGRYVF